MPPRDGDLRRSASPGGRGDRDRSPPPPPRMDVDDRGRNGQANNPGNNLHVSGLSLKVEERDLEEVFSKSGKIDKCQVMRDPHSRESRGFAFVTMMSGDEAEAAISDLNGTELMGRTISVQKARRARARTPTPGEYHGPPKRGELRGGRYAPPPGGYGGGYGGGYDRGYGGGGYGPPRGGRYDDYDRPPPPPRRDDYYGGRDRYDDRDRYGGPPPPRDDPYSRRPPPRDAYYDRYDDRDRSYYRY